MSQHEPLHEKDAQERREEHGERRAPYVSAPVRILYRCDGIDLLAREARVMREEGYLGVVTRYWAGKESPWRIDFGDDYLYLSEDEFEVLL